VGLGAALVVELELSELVLGAVVLDVSVLESFL
jgi:hypothetical protein